MRVAPLAPWVFVVAGACHSPAPSAPTTASPVRVEIVPSADGGDLALADAPADAASLPQLEALVEPGAMVDLGAKAISPAKVDVPLGAREPRPVLVAVHGNFDRPEWTCSVWGEVSDGYPFVVCPRGQKRKDAPGEDRWTYAGSDTAAREIDRTLTATRQRWGAHVSDGPALYAGFSLGAILGVPIVSANPARFPRAILVEGGHDGWTDARAASFARGARDAGITPRVLFVCAQNGCVGDATPAKRTLLRHGVEVEIVSAGNVGHRYDGPVAAMAKSRFAWMVEGLPGWN
jgi:hypothetical protein